MRGFRVAASKYFGFGCVLVAGVLVAGCASKAPAPVSEGARPPVGAGGASAPVTSQAPAEPARGLPPGKAEVYTVKKGDTLYSIALDHGQNYKDVAVWNSLADPSMIKVGQQLRMTSPDGGGASSSTVPSTAVTRPVPVSAGPEVKPLSAPPGVAAVPLPVAGSAANGLKRDPKGGKQPYSEAALAQARKPEEKAAVAVVAPAVAGAVKVEPKPEVKPVDVQPKPEVKAQEAKPVDSPKQEAKPEAVAPAKVAEPMMGGEGVDWGWPHDAKVSAGFSEPSNKGLDFAGKTGSPVLAAADGKVSYTGTAIRGYGNLVIVQHNKTFLSVYAHNSRILVKEGQAVSKGMKIAELGSSDADQPKLHFEIRRNGKPIDPAKVLPPR